VIIPVVALCLVLLPGLLGGSLRRLAGARLRLTWAVGVALLAQIVVIEFLPGDSWQLSATHVATYVPAAAFVWANRRVPGLVILGLGGASNGITIALNGGTLPASPTALRIAGIEQTPGEFTNSGLIHDPRLAFLGDVFAIPATWPLANVFSVGDVLIVLGAGYASLRICGSHWTTPWSAREAGHGTPRHLLIGRSPKPAERGTQGSGASRAAAGTGSGDDASGRPHLPRPRRRADRGRVRREPVEIPERFRTQA